MRSGQSPQVQPPQFQSPQLQPPQLQPPQPRPGLPTSTLPLRLPLAWQLALSFFLVSALALGSVGVLSSALTRAQFRTLLSDQERAQIEAQLQTHLQAGGQLSTFVLPIPSAAGPIDLGPGATASGTESSGAELSGAGRGKSGSGGRGASPTSPDSHTGRGSERPGRPARHSSFVLTDLQFRPLGAPGAGPQGPASVPLPPPERAGAVPVEVNGKTAGYLIPRGRPDIRGANADFLRRTNQAIAWAAAASALLAALLGGWLARRLLDPLTQLQSGIAALRRGEQPTPLPQRPVQDELSDLLGSFETMHAEVLRAQQVGRQLTADIAHDLNTPLTVIRGQLEAMLDGTFQATPARLTRLSDQAGRVARLVADLRLLAQAEAGELPLHPRPTSAAALLREAAQALQEVAAQRGSVLALDVPGELQIRADPDRLRQVLDNLIGNALNHAPGTPVTLRAWAEAGGVCLQVTDGGPGVSEQQLPHLFERLYRADASRQESASRHPGDLGAGSGLGLSISRSIVQAHGGRISARNMTDQGGGLAVELWLPS